MKLHKHFYIAMVILAFSAILAEVYFRWLVGIGAGDAVPLSRPLSSLPKTFGKWQSIEVAMKAASLLKIGSEDILRRRYYTGKKELEVYVVYFGGVRGTAPHHPDVCMPGGGWHNIDSKVVTVPLAGFGEAPLHVHQDVFEHKKAGKRLVVWWEYVHGRNVASRTFQRILWALPGFMGGKRGSVLQVQISHDFDADATDSLKLIEEFMNAFGPHIREVLPDSTDVQSQIPEPATGSRSLRCGHCHHRRGLCLRV